MHNCYGINIGKVDMSNPKKVMKVAEAAGSDNRRRSFQLRIAGKTYQEIGDALGISRQAAFAHVHKELKAIREENKQLAEHYRDIELNRLDRLFDIIMGSLSREENPAMLAQAHKNIELRCKLLGVNAPQELTIHGDDPESILLRMNKGDVKTD